MTKKEIKEFYLSLIDNPDAIWSKDTYSDKLLLHCTCNNIRITAYSENQLELQYIGGDSRFDNTSGTFTYRDIGISYFRLIFPYFGVASRICRRIKRDKKNINNIEAIHKLNSISKVLSKDKALVRDNKLNQLLK